nr:MAG TPA: hypothetical protein [Caudoviricetes sp.]
MIMQQKRQPVSRLSFLGLCLCSFNEPSGFPSSAHCNSLTHLY